VIFIAGFAKSGSTWFANMLTELDGFDEYTPIGWPIEGPEPHRLDIYPGIFDAYRHRLAVIKSHTWGFPENAVLLKQELNGRYLITVRDPRDCLISAYWFIRREPRHWDYANTQLPLTDYITLKLETGQFEREFVDWLRMWLRHRDPDNSLILRYDDLLADTQAEFKKTLGFLRFEVSPNQIARIVRRHSFERVTGRQRGQEDPSQFVRKAKPEEWREVFTPDQAQRAAAIARDMLDHFGWA
jgi:hypothetical protein